MVLGENALGRVTFLKDVTFVTIRRKQYACLQIQKDLERVLAESMIAKEERELKDSRRNARQLRKRTIVTENFLRFGLGTNLSYIFTNLGATFLFAPVVTAYYSGLCRRTPRVNLGALVHEL